MPINAPWKPFTKIIMKRERESEGVYEIATASHVVIYIGSARNLQSRLLGHLAKRNTCIDRYAYQYRVEYTADLSSREQALFRTHLNFYGRFPKCNQLAPPKLRRENGQ